MKASKQVCFHKTIRTLRAGASQAEIRTRGNSARRHIPEHNAPGLFHLRPGPVRCPRVASLLVEGVAERAQVHFGFSANSMSHSRVWGMAWREIPIRLNERLGARSRWPLDCAAGQRSASASSRPRLRLGCRRSPPGQAKRLAPAALKPDGAFASPASRRADPALPRAVDCSARCARRGRASTRAPTEIAVVSSAFRACVTSERVRARGDFSSRGGGGRVAAGPGLGLLPGWRKRSASSGPEGCGPGKGDYSANPDAARGGRNSRLKQHAAASTAARVFSCTIVLEP